MKSFIERAVVVWVMLAALLIGLGAVYSAWWLLSRSAVIIFMVVLAVFLALVLDPVVERLAKRMPRWAGVVLVYVGIGALLALLGILIVPLLIHQGKQFSDWIRDRNNPLVQFTTWAINPAAHPELQPHPSNPLLARVDTYIANYHANASGELQDAVNKRIAELKNYAGTLVGSIVNIALRGLGWVFRGFLVMVISIYLLLDKSRFLEWFQSTVSPARRGHLERLFHDMVGVLSAYLRGLAMMVLFVGGAVTLLLLFTGIKYWLFIGCLAGILEVIPYFGAIGGAIPAVILGFQKSTGVGVGLIIAFVVINQLEGHLVAPLAMGHSMHVRPLTVLLALLLGAEIAGVGGMILAVPVLGVVRVLLTHAWRYFHEPDGPDGQSLRDAAEEAIAPHGAGANGQDPPPDG